MPLKKNPVAVKVHPNPDCDCAFCSTRDWRRPRNSAAEPELGLIGKCLICFNYNFVGCVEPKCKRLHLCCKWLYGRCASDECPLRHRIKSSRNEVILASLRLEGTNDEDLREVLLRSALEASVLSGHGGDLFQHWGKKGQLVASWSQETAGSPEGYSVRSFLSLLGRIDRKRSSAVEQVSAHLQLLLSWIQEERCGDPLLDVHAKDPSQRTAYAWKYLDDEGSWVLQGRTVAGVSLGLQCSTVLEEAFAGGELNFLAVRIRSRTYVFSTDAKGTSIKQTNTLTGVEREVKRELVVVRNDIPSHWMPMIPIREGGTTVVAAPLSTYDEEFKIIKERFELDGGIPGSTILQIYRVQNPSRRRRFESRREEMSRLYKTAGENVSELLLFHGTSSKAVRGICKYNFDRRRSGKTCGRTSYGKGVYFARKSSSSHRYAVPDADETRVMFVASVLVGLTCLGDPEMKYPAKWNEEIQCDTAVNDVSQPKIYVKFNDHEYYPAYLVQYGTACALCESEF